MSSSSPSFFLIKTVKVRTAYFELLWKLSSFSLKPGAYLLWTFGLGLRAWAQPHSTSGLDADLKIKEHKRWSDRVLIIEWRRSGKAEWTSWVWFSSKTFFVIYFRFNLEQLERIRTLDSDQSSCQNSYVHSLESVSSLLYSHDDWNQLGVKLMILTEAKAWGGGVRLLKPRAWLKVGALANHALQLSPLTALLCTFTGRLNWHSLFYFIYFFSKTTNVSLQHLVRVPALKRSPHRPLPSRQHGLQGQGPPHEPLQCAPGPGMPCHLLRLPRFVI